MLVLSCVTLIGCDNNSDRFDVPTVEVPAGGKRFAVPYEHTMSSLPIGLERLIYKLNALSDETEILFYFSAAWMSAHIDGYQPVLNNGFEGDAVLIYVGEQIKKDYARPHSVSIDLWYKRGTYENRVIMDQKEPNTGFYIIQPIPYQSRPDYDGEHWFLSETLPDESKPYPQTPPWLPYTCYRSKGIIENAKVVTKCLIDAQIADDIFILVDFFSENLRVREEVFAVLAKEINSWIIDKDARNER